MSSLPPLGGQQPRPAVKGFGLGAELDSDPGRGIQGTVTKVGSTTFGLAAEGVDPYAPDARARVSGDPYAQGPGLRALPPPDQNMQYGNQPQQQQQGYPGYAQKPSGAMLSGQAPSRVSPGQYDNKADVMTRRAAPQMSQEDAARRIQASYRGSRVRRQREATGQPVFTRTTARPYRGPAASAAQHAAAAYAVNGAGVGPGGVGPMGANPVRLPPMPVIDINKLPRYGLLAPPIDRPETDAGRFVDFDRATNAFVKNRGTLRAAVEKKTGYLEDAPMRMWSQFSERQKQRFVPIPPDANRRVLPETHGYRLRVLRVQDLPLHTTFDGRTFEFQLGVSLYDEAYGTFYGNTVYSMSDAYDRNRAAQKNAIDLDFSFDVYYHSKVSDPRCMAVVEIIMLERMLDGVIKGEYSLGWALLPLFRVAGGDGPSGVSLDQQPGKPLSVPLVSGTPRYLLFRNVYNEDLRPPKVVPNCSVMFQAEAYAAADAYIPLLPEDFLVTYSDVIPGLRRFDTSGQLSITTKTVISTLASPMLSPTYSVVLRRLQLALPARLHELLLSLDPKRPHAFIPPDATHANQMISSPVVSLTYTIRVSIHNGRTFVGPAYELDNITHLDVPGWKVLQVPAPDAVFDYVMGDVLTSVVVELLVAPSQVLHPELAMPAVQYCVGNAAFVPFAFISDDGSEAEVAVGVHRYALGATKLRDAPVLDWRALLGDSMVHDVPQPLVEFQLFETGRTPIPPPLSRAFAIIEHQREEEEARGELPLEAVLAPVPVPLEIAPPPTVILDNQPLPPAFMPSPNDIGMMQDQGMGEQRAAAMDPWGGQQQQQYQQQPVVNDGMRDLAEAMQRQLTMLTRAVEELRDERKSLRNSVLALVDRPIGGAPGSTHLPLPPPPGDFRASRPGPGGPSDQTPDDIRRLMDLPPTADLGDLNAFSGGPPPVPGGPGALPSRLVMQQLYDAGMLDGLPDDVQGMLRRRGGARGPANSPIDLSLEARDPRMASDVVFQFLAFRHHDTLNAPVNVQSLYFTFQFYHFAPTTTTMAYLVQPSPARLHDTASHRQEPGGPEVPDPTTINATRILVTNHPDRKGAGVTLKYKQDATLDALPSGQTAQQAAYEGNMHFSQYLAHKTLSIDVWDGESLLQVGTATVSLQSLLRQGRDFAELLVEVPIMDQSNALPESLGQQPALATGPGNASDSPTPTILSRGSVVLRLINIGREPANPSGGVHESNVGPAKPGKKTRVRAKPAWTIKGAIARELANGAYDMLSNPAQAAYAAGGGGEQYLSEMDGRNGKRPHSSSAPSDPRFPTSPGGGGGVPFGGGGVPVARPRAPPDVAGAPVTDEMKVHILEKTHAKSTRLHVMENMLARAEEAADLPSYMQGVPRAGGMDENGHDSQYRHVQKQLLTDVSSVRCRQKDAVVKENLRRNMMVSRVIRPAYGEVCVYEHEFVNPFSSEMVFEIRVSDDRELSVLRRMDEYRALRAANARFFGSASQPVGALEEEVMAGNRIYLQAHEKITLPFKLQSFEPPEGYLGPRSGVVQAPSDGSVFADARRSHAAHPSTAPSATTGGSGHVASGAGHSVTVDFVSVSHDHAIMVLELNIVPRPLVIDRTFRFYQPEHSLMRQTVKMKQLAGVDSTFAGGALRSLAVACSHPDIIVGAGSSGLVGGGGERDEVYIKYKCGGAPEVTHFYTLLYTDRLLARPVEVWQCFAHCLRKVDMRAVIGQTSQASVVVRGAAATRRVAAYSSHPDELQVTPSSFVLVSGALTELLLSFRPVAAGMRDIKVHLVDTESRELVYAMIVTAEAQGPLITRTFEVEVPAGSVANKKIMYTNPYQSYRTFTLRSNQPWLCTFTPQRLSLPAGATRPLGMTFDARAATTGILDVLVFVNDEEDKTEECFKCRVRIYR